ncbi:uncharacterized protein LOC134289586 [Aedes albopictus]|uniref:Peptidase aspartic putative domain-containing protein n=1 Tax=Aedes albopictus TaxID=7160 RepID=A0ABM1ZAU7_AEDAL
MEENHQLELERKRLELKRLTNKAMMGILNSTNGEGMDSLNEQAAAVGVSKVGDWIQGIVGEMQNLSVARETSMIPEKTTSVGPTFDISSTPTTAGVHLSSLDRTLSPTIRRVVPGVSVSQPLLTSLPNTTVVQTQLPLNARSEIYRCHELGPMPRSAVKRMPPGLGASAQTNVVTACSTVPTVGLSSTCWGLPDVSNCAVVNNPVTTLPQPQYQPGLSTNAYTATGMLPRSNPAMVFNDGGISGGYGYQNHAPQYTANVSSGRGFPIGINNIPELPRHHNPPIASGYAANVITGSGVPVYQPYIGLQQPHHLVGQLQALPTQHQLMARQVMPKDLPPFRGDPEDWPLFYSAYVNSTTACGYSDVENLARLQKALQGKAFDAVKSRLLLPACVPQVLSTLYMLYGRPELIIQTLLNKVREAPAPKSDKLDTLISFGMTVQNLVDHLEAAGQTAHMCNPTLLQELVEKIPAHLRLNWALYKNQFAVVDLRLFATYMSTLVAAATDVTVVADARQTQICRKEKNFLNTHVETEPPKREVKQENISGVICLACHGPNHKVKDCVVFKKRDPDSRWETVREYHLCKMCLGKHGTRPCKQQGSCGTEGCQLRHHPLLHAETRQHQSAAENEQDKSDSSVSSGEGVNAHHSTGKSTLFRIIPVQLYWNGKSVETFAFLDDGSSMTLIEQSVAVRLGIDNGEPHSLGLTWTGNINRQVPNSKRVSIDISGMGDSKRFPLDDTRTVCNLELPKQTLKYDELARQYAHLRGLPINNYESVSPGILIGSNNASLIATLKLREGELGDPLAAKTRLGWSVYGHVASLRKQENFSFHIREFKGECAAHQHNCDNIIVKPVGITTKWVPKAMATNLSKQIALEKVLSNSTTKTYSRKERIAIQQNQGSVIGCLLTKDVKISGSDLGIRTQTSGCQIAGIDEQLQCLEPLAVLEGRLSGNAESVPNVRARYGLGDVGNTSNTAFEPPRDASDSKPAQLYLAGKYYMSRSCPIY